MLLSPTIESYIKSDATKITYGDKYLIQPFSNVKILNDFRFWLQNQEEDEEAAKEAIDSYIEYCKSVINTTYSKENLSNMLFDIIGNTKLYFEMGNDLKGDFVLKVFGVSLDTIKNVKNLLKSLYMIDSEIKEGELDIKINIPAWGEVIQ